LSTAQTPSPSDNQSDNHSLLVATHNKGKLKEILRIFSVEIPDLRLFTLDDFPGAEEVDEVGETFEENALLKARAGFLHSGIPTLADDSGLAVDALGGKPGIHSARYSGGGDAANIEKVLRELDGVEIAKRTARFVTVVAFIDGDDPVITERGELEGVIVDAPRGEGGFGYDPIFAPINSASTLAEISATEKDEISHRGRALRVIAPKVGIRFAQFRP
jgi:XTP/dITP diphosphohydrolase